MKNVRLFNLTDVETPSLKENGWVNVVVAGSGFAVRPGESVDFVLRPESLPMIQSYVAAGLLAVDTLPAHYTVTKRRRSL